VIVSRVDVVLGLGLTGVLCGTWVRVSLWLGSLTMVLGLGCVLRDSF
jgi:hypothetical protein